LKQIQQELTEIEAKLNNLKRDGGEREDETRPYMEMVIYLCSTITSRHSIAAAAKYSNEPSLNRRDVKT
jgi:hypothetical protein